MFAVGVVGRLQRSVWPLTSHRQEAKLKQVSSSEVAAIFVCLGAGIVASLVILLLEMLASSASSHQRHQYPDWGWYN